MSNRFTVDHRDNGDIQIIDAGLEDFDGGMWLYRVSPEDAVDLARQLAPETPETDDLGRIAYEAWQSHWRGDKADWSVVSPEIRASWEAEAKAVANAVRPPPGTVCVDRAVAETASSYLWELDSLVNQHIIGLSDGDQAAATIAWVLSALTAALATEDGHV